MFQRYGYILPINEKWWSEFCDRNRKGKTLQAYVRRGKVGPKNAELLLFYVTHPFKEIRGFGKFVDRITGDAGDLWRTHGQETCLTHNEYSSFLQGRQNATFILFKSLHELLIPVPVDTITKITGIHRMPQTGKYINREETYKLLRTWPKYLTKKRLYALFNPFPMVLTTTCIESGLQTTINSFKVHRNKISRTK